MPEKIVVIQGTVITDDMIGVTRDNYQEVLEQRNKQV